MNPDNYTSPDLSKKLAENGCELETSAHVCEFEKREIIVDLLNCDGQLLEAQYGKLIKKTKTFDILNDICVKYAKEFFGEYIPPKKVSPFLDRPPLDYRGASEMILRMLQNGDKQEAENLIWEHCLFNPANQK